MPKAEAWTPARTGKGFMYNGGGGGRAGEPSLRGLDPRTAGVRIMDPKPGFPDGYATYMNSSGQTVDPYSGRTIGTDNPSWHIPRR